MDSSTPQETRSGTPERRNLAPPGRLRRIGFAHGPGLWAMIGVVVVLMLLFAVTSAVAVNERFKRDVAAIAYARDARALGFLLETEEESLEAAADTVRTLDARASELAMEARPYLVVSIEERRVWYIEGEDTLYTAPVAVGSGQTIVLGGRTKRFQTPRGKMSITRKELDPIWTPPDWHYQKIANQQGLRLVNMSNAPRDALTQAGFAPGEVPIADGVVYIPPYGSPQRKHTGVLGAAKLEMRDGYYFHGTNNEASIGTAASAGCIRLRRADVLWLYDNVPVGTDVYIY